VAGDGDEVREVTDTSLFRGGELSNTFHGRDIFAPVAAHLARGVEFARLGPRIDDAVQLDREAPVVHDDGSVSGAVIHVDRFGNLVTNIRADVVASLAEGSRGVRFLGIEVGEPVNSYGSVDPGCPLAIVDSFGFLEIAVNGGSAEAHFNASRGDPIRLG